MRLLNSTFILLFASSLIGQNAEINGIVFDRISRHPVQEAKVSVLLTDNTTLTDQLEEIELPVPDNATQLTLAQEDYEHKMLSWEPGSNDETLKIGLTSLDSNRMNTFWKTDKNAASVSVLELLNIALAIRYERSLHIQHSVGVHSSFYLLGRNPVALGSEHNYYPRYYGFRLSPFYRFYPLSRESFGLFVEAKGHVGYIHFSKLPYHYTSQNPLQTNVTYSFWGTGFGVSVGIALRGLTSRGMINFSVGYQYFPIDAPESITLELDDGTVITQTTDTNWWYKGGPGTIVDFKITIGGIF